MNKEELIRAIGELFFEKMQLGECPTNGEVIQALFPNQHIKTKSHTVWVGYDAMSFTREWWNAPYKAESEIQETETWNGIHAQITAPKGTFDKI